MWEVNFVGEPPNITGHWTLENCANLLLGIQKIDEIMDKSSAITYRSRCSKHIRSLATRSFLAMIFFRFSTVLELSTSTEKLPPVVVEMLSVIGGKVQLFSVLLLPHPSARSRGSFDEDFSIVFRAGVGLTTLLKRLALALIPTDLLFRLNCTVNIAKPVFSTLNCTAWSEPHFLSIRFTFFNTYSAHRGTRTHMQCKFLFS